MGLTAASLAPHRQFESVVNMGPLVGKWVHLIRVQTPVQWFEGQQIVIMLKMAVQPQKCQNCSANAEQSQGFLIKVQGRTTNSHCW